MIYQFNTLYNNKNPYRLRKNKLQYNINNYLKNKIVFISRLSEKC